MGANVTVSAVAPPTAVGWWTSGWTSSVVELPDAFVNCAHVTVSFDEGGVGAGAEAESLVRPGGGGAAVAVLTEIGACAWDVGVVARSVVVIGSTLGCVAAIVVAVAVGAVLELVVADAFVTAGVVVVTVAPAVDVTAVCVVVVVVHVQTLFSPLPCAL